MSDAFPQIVRCTLGQGGGPAARVLPLELEPEPPVTHSILAAWALNLPVVMDLGEPTREEL